ncbi:uncharacterized protein LOC118183140 [Stegodyphus dumicola]|uniref:uncharacterized protein LOC118183140 n=1 Tax=Stegodyphus dumicola TaxID=202533 RepID=UPI0015ADC091|nr:uncharacterized protein LOC118183140 [Stegodyphus dumicola]
MATFGFIIFSVLLYSTSGQDEIVYPLRYENQQLATRINCQVEETQHFHYSSTTKLWGVMGGEVIINADVALRCLGDDKGGKYESEALKYLTEVSNLVIEERNEKVKRAARSVTARRQKKDVKEFFTSAWNRIKNFFSRVFGRGEPEITPTLPSNPVDERKELPEDESEEDFNMNDLLVLYSTPFQFVQLANGSIPEIRFADNEADGRVKNFKRHLVDAFATQLNFNKRENAVVENSVIGEHTSNYNITVTEKSAPLNIAGWSAVKMEQPTVVINKQITENDILSLAPSEALNDRDKIALNMQQMQVFQGGRMLSSSGTSSVVLLPNAEGRRSRQKRDTEDDILAYFKAHSVYEIQLKKKRKRSAKNSFENETREKRSYVPASRTAEVEDHPNRQRLRLLQRSTGDITSLFENLLSSQGHDYEEKMQALFEMIEREINYNLDKEKDSVSNAARKLLSEQTMHNMCSKNFSICKDFLQLLALAGGPEVENVLLSFFKSETSLSPIDLQTVADIISDVSHPSPSFLTSLSELIKEEGLDEGILSSLCLSLGHLGSNAEPTEKNKVSAALTELLKKRQNECRSDPLILDVLEAIGNLGCENTIAHVIEVSSKCRTNEAVQIACAHALRRSSHLESVQQWMKNIITDGDCEITQTVIGSLMDKIQDQEMTPDEALWPRYGFNEIDKILRDRLHTSRCNMEDIIRYFYRKKNTEAKEIAENYFGPESEPWNSEHDSRQKRAIWDDLNCNEWTEDSKFNPIQDKEEFATDRATYNKRKSCLAFRRLGVKGANSEIYAGMFAGLKEPSDPPKYKLFTKFVSGLNFLGHEMEIGSFYFYHHSGQTKAYVRIMGRTRQEFTHDGCTPTDLKYRPLKHIPLYLLSISTVQISLGIHLSSQLALDTACPNKEVYQLEPLTNVRIGGEALGTVLLARGGVSLGANFNYKLQFTFTPSPNMCLKGSHGYDPMSISFETYYQLWNTVKNDWGKTRTWKPNFLSWEIKRGEMKPWFDDTCIATEPYESLPFDTERELE